MNSLHSGLQNKDTYYLNQFYLEFPTVTNLIKSIQTRNCSKQHSYGYLTDSGTSTLKRQH